MITSGVIGGLGDLLCQFLEFKARHYLNPQQSKQQDVFASEKFKFDYKRARSFFLINTFWMSPIYYYNYTKLLPYFVPVVTKTNVFKKVAIDKSTVSPLYMLSFFPMLNFIEGVPFKQSIQDVKDKYIPALKSDFAISTAFLKFCGIIFQRLSLIYAQYI
eukprot:403359891